MKSMTGEWLSREEMRRFWTVVRTGLKSNFGLALLKHRLLNEKKDRWLIPIFGLAAIGVLPMFYGIVLIIRGAYGFLQPIGQERAIMTLGILLGEIVILFFGIYYIISSFYFSRDLEFLIPLPLRPSEVIASKFFIIMVNEYLTIAPIVLPFLITYGVLSRGGLGFWINAFFIYLTLPVIPLALVSLAVVAMMRLINISRKKDLLILLGSIILIVLAMAYQVAMGKSSGGELGGDALGRWIASPNSLLRLVGSRFPPSIWATIAVVEGFSLQGLTNLALFLAVSLVLFAGMVALAEKLFYRGLIGLSETTGRRRRLTQEEMSRRISSGKRPLQAIFLREWRLMNRTPVFLLNGTLVVVLFPVIFIVLATIDTSSRGRGSEVMFLLRMMTSVNPLYTILATALFMAICGSLNGTASSAFSREGKQFWISKVIPVEPRVQVAAKFLHSYIIAVLGVITASIVGVAYLNLKATYLLVAAGLALICGALLTAVGLIIDLARPLLDWTNPQKAIKQNFNVLLAMLADISILTALFFGVRGLIRAKLSANVIIALIYIALAGLAAIAYLFLLRFADKRYREIES